MNSHTVAREARQIADDARKTKGLSDPEAECLRDLLQDDEAFSLLVTAQQSSVKVSTDYHDVDEEIEGLARKGAGALGKAIDEVVADRIEDAEAIVALASKGGAGLTWSVAMQLYQAGFETVESLQEAELHDFVAETAMAPELAERVRRDVAELEEVQ